MGKPRKWFANVRRKILSTPAPSNIILLHTNPSSSNLSQQILLETTAPLGHDTAPFSSLLPTSPFFSPQEVAAATKIQALFRGHLARLARRALKSLVKLQALVRGVYVRRQTRMALLCMHTLVRLQIRIHTRQLLH